MSRSASAAFKRMMKRNQAVRLQELTSQRDELAGALREAVALLALDVPDRDCWCHIAPPCSDCVDHSRTREIIDSAKAALEGVES